VSSVKSDSLESLLGGVMACGCTLVRGDKLNIRVLGVSGLAGDLG
jgi:hypothetical protein